MSSPAKWSRSRTTRASRSKRSRSWPRIAPGPSACRSPCFPSWATAATTPRSAATRVASPSASTPRSPSTTASRVSATPSRPSPKPAAWSAPSVLWLPQGSLYRYAPGGAVSRRRAVREPTVEAPSNLGRRVASDRFHRRCVYTSYFTMVRDAFKRKYGLPDDEFFGGHLTWSSYLACGTPAGALGGLCCWWPQLFCGWPCIHGFTACASFQNGHFFKHASPIKRDYECCLYKHVGIAIFGTGQMPQPSAPRGAPPAADSCHYE